MASIIKRINSFSNCYINTTEIKVFTYTYNKAFSPLVSPLMSHTQMSPLLASHGIEMSTFSPLLIHLPLFCLLPSLLQFHHLANVLQFIQMQVLNFLGNLSSSSHPSSPSCIWVISFFYSSSNPQLLLKLLRQSLHF